MKQHGLAANPILRSEKALKSWEHITDDLKHSMNLWSILETRTKNSPMTEPMDLIRFELEKLKGLMEEFAL